MNDQCNKKIFKSIITLVLLFATTLVATSIISNAAIYQNTQFIHVSRTLNPDSTKAKVEQYQDINYRIYGDPFELGVADAGKTEISLVLDESTSMNARVEGKSCIQWLKTASKNFVDRFNTPNSKVKISIVSYSSKANNPQPLKAVSTHYSEIISSINDLNANGSTNIGDAMRRAYYILQNGEADAKKYIIIMTDGEPTNYTRMSFFNNNYFMEDGNTKFGQVFFGLGHIFEGRGLLYALKVGNEKIKIAKYTTFVVGFSEGAKASNLNDIGAACGSDFVSPGKRYYRGTSGDELVSMFDAIAKIILAEMPIKFNILTETFPENVEVLDSSLPSFLKINTINGRTVLSGIIPNLRMNRNADGKYQLQEVNFTIKVQYKSSGTKTFNGLSIAYEDPYTNNKYVVIDNIPEVIVGKEQTSVEVNPSAITIVKGTTFDALHWVVNPIDAEDKSVSIASDDTSIATYDPATNKITGISTGVTKIWVTLNGNPYEDKNYCEVTVIDPKIRLSSNFLSMKDGQTKTITLTISDAIYKGTSGNLSGVLDVGVELPNAKITVHGDGKKKLTFEAEYTMTDPKSPTGSKINAQVSATCQINALEPDVQ